MYESAVGATVYRACYCTGWGGTRPDTMVGESEIERYDGFVFSTLVQATILLHEYEYIYYRDMGAQTESFYKSELCFRL